MVSRTWKKFESWCAWFIGGRRYPANTGDHIDVESDAVIAQCKYKKNLSHYELSMLALEMELYGRQADKLGVVLHQFPPGRGRQSPGLITMTWDVFDQYFCLRKE